MRRLIALLLTVMMISTAAFASEIDISGMTDEELISLKTSIEDELAVRGATDGDVMLEGAYEVGVDIAAGKYNLYSSEDNVRAVIFNTKELLDSRKSSDVVYLNIGEPGYASLTDGQWIEVLADVIVLPAKTSNFAPK